VRVCEEGGELWNGCGVGVRGRGAWGARDEADGCGCYDYAAGLAVVGPSEGEDVVGVCSGAAVDEGIGVQSRGGGVDVACSTG